MRYWKIRLKNVSDPLFNKELKYSSKLISILQFCCCQLAVTAYFEGKQVLPIDFTSKPLLSCTW